MVQSLALIFPVNILPKSTWVRVLAPDFCSHLDAIAEISQWPDFEERDFWHSFGIGPYWSSTITAEVSMHRLAAAANTDVFFRLSFVYLDLRAVYREIVACRSGVNMENS